MAPGLHRQQPPNEDEVLLGTKDKMLIHPSYSLQYFVAASYYFSLGYPQRLLC
uniref:Uncharacterized protein n=1 Tax=Arundo donax TaxID=35708 RepID=A0A0A9D8K1_ARUDO